MIKSLLPLAACLLVADPALGQNRTSCADCRIVPVRVATLGLGEPLAWSPSGFFRDSMGRFWLSPVGDAPMVFDSTGAFVGKVGRQSDDIAINQALDAFAMAGNFFSVGDSVGVVDISSPRIKLVDADLEISREIRLPGIIRAVHVVEWPSNVIVSGAIPAPASAGWPLHRLDLSGDEAVVLQSFGDNGGELRSEQSTLINFRTLAPARSGALWAAEVLRYQIHLFSPDGELRRTRSQDRDWFNRPTSPLVQHGAEPGKYVDGLSVDEEGRIWTFVRVPSRDWRGPARDDRRTMSQKWHSRVEVLTPDGSEVLAAAELGDLVLYVGADGYAAVYERLDTGSPHLIHITKFSLSGQE